MKKRTLIFIPLLTVLIFIANLIILNRWQTPAWKARLEHYLTYLRETEQSSFQVISTDNASAPANYSTAMSAESYSDSAIFETTHNQYPDYAAGLQPIPYPPEQVVCVLLEGNGQRELVYVALHNSLYNADWIVHISPEPWGSAILQSHLQILGCTPDT